MTNLMDFEMMTELFESLCNENFVSRINFEVKRKSQLCLVFRQHDRTNKCNFETAGGLHAWQEVQ